MFGSALFRMKHYAKLVSDDGSFFNEDTPAVQEALTLGNNTPKQSLGLINVGNACYMATALQCFAHIPEIAALVLLDQEDDVRKNFFAARMDPKSGEIGLNLTDAFYNMICNIWQIGETPFDDVETPKNEKERENIETAKQYYQAFLFNTFKDTMGKTCQNPAWSGAVVQDTQEFLNELLNQLQTEQVLFSQADPYFYSKLFAGMFKNTIRCPDCNTEFSGYERTDILIIDPPRIQPSRGRLSQNETTSLVDLFKQSYVLDEILNDENKYLCSTCNKHVRATKTLRLYTVPHVAIVMIRKFEFAGRNSKKLDFSVGFSLKTQSIRKIFGDDNLPDVLYELTGIACHIGFATGGHYYAYCRHPVMRKKWLYLNDCTSNEVADPEKIPEREANSAYLLFYRKIVHK
jgi:ubiquitin C-terminal hydrolase